MTEVTPPVLIKDGGIFLCSRPDGEITAECGSGFGLFHRDTRYLSRYAILVGGKSLLTLMSSGGRGRQAVHEMTNDKVTQTDGRDLDLQSLRIRLERSLDREALSMTDRLLVRNFTTSDVTIRVSFAIDALFEDIFELRGTPPGRRGPTRTLDLSDGGLGFFYEGADGVVRRLDVAFSDAIQVREQASVQMIDLMVALAGQASKEITVTFTVNEKGAMHGAPAPRPTYCEGLMVESDDAPLDAVVTRALRDLVMLETGLEDNFIAGGMPWFVSPFGRDSLLSAIQTVALDPRPAADAARLFARYQGKTVDSATGEQVGKIHHELRLGAMARLGEIPHRPSYMSVDCTPLFLVLIGRYMQWTGNLKLFRDLRPAIDAALVWMATDGDSDGDGYLDYSGKTQDGDLINQGWKDSTAGVPRKDGGSPEGPIALCEVQGYAYLAKTLIAEALRAAGEPQTADRLEAEAHALRARFNRDFWMEDEGCYALGLEKGGRQLTVVTSNAGQVLWSGIADPDKAERTADRLMRSDMNSGWGVRTLSEQELSYNPLNYHLGCVWPFDNAMIVEGLRRYDLDQFALRLFSDTVDAAGCFGLSRLPEFYGGFAREADLTPARCPFADPMQAWSAGAVPQMLIALLGLAPDDAGVRLHRPVLPPWIRRLEIRGIRSPAGRVDCHFARDVDGELQVRVLVDGRSQDGR